MSMAAKKQSTGKATKKAKAGARAKKATAKKPAAKKAKAKAAKPSARKPAARGGATTGLDKSVEQFRESLERSVTLSRDRLQEVVDDAVKRGRMTHGDAEKMIGELLKRGRKQTDTLLSELEKLVRQARRKLP